MSLSLLSEGSSDARSDGPAQDGSDDFIRAGEGMREKRSSFVEEFRGKAFSP